MDMEHYLTFLSKCKLVNVGGGVILFKGRWGRFLLNQRFTVQEYKGIFIGECIWLYFFLNL